MKWRPKFSLSVLLVLVTLSAVGAWAYRVYNVPHLISESDAARIEVGMSQWQVRYLLGPPHHTYRGARVSWAYDFPDGDDYFDIWFDDSLRVKSLSHRSYLPLVSEPPAP